MNAGRTHAAWTCLVESARRRRIVLGVSTVVGVQSQRYLGTYMSDSVLVALILIHALNRMQPLLMTGASAGSSNS